MPEDEVGGAFEISSRDRVAQGCIEVAHVLEQVAGLELQAVGLDGITNAQPCQQQIAEQVVVAKPPPLAVERDEEQVARPLQLLEHVAAVVGRQQFVEPCWAHLLEHRRALHEPRHLLRYAVEDFLDQIVGDHPVSARR